MLSMNAQIIFLGGIKKNFYLHKIRLLAIFLDYTSIFILLLNTSIIKKYDKTIHCYIKITHIIKFKNRYIIFIQLF